MIFAENGKTPFITEILTEFNDTDEVSITITGFNFLNKNTLPYISLGYGVGYELDEETVSDNQLILSANLTEGDYLMLVSIDSQFKKDKTAAFELTIGAVGAVGSQGTQGTQGTQGEQGMQGEQGKQGMPGEQGIQGEQGILGEQGEQGGDQGESGLAPGFRWEGTKLQINVDPASQWGVWDIPVELKAAQTGLDISQLCLLSTYQYLKSLKQGVPANDFSLKVPIDEIRRICLHSCPVSFNNFIHQANNSLLYTSQTTPGSSTRINLLSIINSLKESDSPLYCKSLVDSFWNAKIDLLDAPDVLKTNKVTTQSHMYSLVKAIEGPDNSHLPYTYLESFQWGGSQQYVNWVSSGGAPTQTFPRFLEDLLEIIPYTLYAYGSSIAWPYQYDDSNFYDGWGQKFIYYYSGLADTPYSITSKGADGIEGTGDDLRYDSLYGYNPLRSNDLKNNEILNYILDTTYALGTIQDTLENFAKNIGNGKYPETLNALIDNNLIDELPTDAWMLIINYVYNASENTYTLSAPGIDRVPSDFDLLGSVSDYFECSSSEKCIK